MKLCIYILYYGHMHTHAHTCTQCSSKTETIMQLFFHDQECKHPLQKCMLYWKYLLKQMKVSINNQVSMQFQLTTAANTNLNSFINFVLFVLITFTSTSVLHYIVGDAFTCSGVIQLWKVTSSLYCHCRLPKGIN